MGSEESLLCCGDHSADLGNWQSRRVGREHCVRSQVRQYARKQRSFDFEVFGNRLNYPVALRNAGQIAIEGSRRNQPRIRRLIKRGGPGLAQSLKSPARRFHRAFLRCNVEHQHRNPSIRQVSGDARTHGACAEDSGPPD